jgi:hypothetical protein
MLDSSAIVMAYLRDRRCLYIPDPESRTRTEIDQIGQILMV